VEEEFLQSCFHITVYKSYVPDSPPDMIADANAGRPAIGPAATAEASHPSSGARKAARRKAKISGARAAGGAASLGR
jgi:hypothetical protein